MDLAFIANTNSLELIGLKDDIAGSYINNAIVSVTVKDSTGANVGGQTWPTTMDYVAASNGIYRAFLSENIAFIKDKVYTAYIEANGGVNRVGHWEFKFQAKVRTGETETT